MDAVITGGVSIFTESKDRDQSSPPNVPERTRSPFPKPPPVPTDATVESLDHLVPKSAQKEYDDQVKLLRDANNPAEAYYPKTRFASFVFRLLGARVNPRD